mgnify:CR=1 FL=1
MRGFNTKKAQSCKDGGLIRGPGTGTSDSIPRGFKPGTFIMPADSTKAIGPDVLENIAKVPTKVSNGEFAHTPKQVHAVGINALRMMKDATHSPKDAGVYFANGGAVQGRGAKGFAIGGEVTNDVTRIGSSYSGGNVGGNITVNGQQPSGTFSSSSPVPTPTPPRPAPVAPVVQAVQYTQPSTPATTPATPALSAMATPPATPQAVAKPVDSFTARNNAVSASSITNNGGRFDTTPAVPSTAPVDTSVTPRRSPVGFDPMQPAQKFADGGDVRGFQTPVQRLAGGGAVEDQALAALRRAREAQPVGSPNIAAIDQSIAQRNQSIGGTRSALSAIAAPFQKPVQTVAPNPTDMRLSANTQATPMESQAPEVMTDAQRGGAAPAVQVPSLSQQAAQPAPAQPVAQALAQVPMLGAVEAKGFQAPSVRHSGNNWKSENDLRNARVSASSITANGGRFDQTRKGQISPQAATYAAMLGTDQALRQAQPGMAQAAMRENAGLQREGMQQAGANQRAGLGFQTAQQRLAMEQETQGFANRAAQQSEQLRNTLLDPNATPEQRRQAQQSLLALQGKSANGEWGVQVTPAIKNLDGSTSAGSIVRYNKATGQTEVVQQPGQGGAKAAPSLGAVQQGYRFKGGDPANPASWERV